MKKIIIPLISVTLLLLLTSCRSKTYPITLTEIIGEYYANKGKSIVKIYEDGTYKQEIDINGKIENNYGNWEVLSPDGENNIRLSFSNFILHMSSDSTLDSTLRKPKEFRTYAEKNKGNENELYIAICYYSFCFIKKE